MIDLVTGLFPDPIRLLTHALVLLAGAVLVLGILEILLFVLSSILLSRREGRSTAPPDLAVLLPVLALGAGFSLVSPRDLTAQDVPKIEARFTRIFTSDSLMIGSASPSPDGRWIAFDGFRNDVGDIFVVSAQGGDPVRLTNGLHNNQSPQWFPSGDRIAFQSDQIAEGQLPLFYMMSVSIDPETGRPTSPARQVTLEPARGWAISPDGRWIVYLTYVGKGPLRVIPSEGGAVRDLVAASETLHWGNPAWSSDSRVVYFEAREEDEETTHLMRVSVEGGEVEEVSSMEGSIGAIAPDARYLLRQVDGKKGDAPVLQVMSPAGEVSGEITLHRNMSSGLPEEFRFDGTGTTAVVRDLGGPVFVSPVPTGSATQISEGQVYESVLGWASDNRKVFYRTRLNGRESVLRTPLEGGPTIEVPLPESAEGPVIPSPDGEYLAYALGSPADTGRTVMIRRVSDGETRVMTDAFLAGLDLGPQGGQVLGPGGGATDGGEFLFLQQNEGRVELCASSPEGLPRVIRGTAPGPQTGELYDYSLGVYGDWVAYAETLEEESTLFLSTGEGEPARTLATIDGWVHGISWSHDRRWIVAGRWWRGQGEDRFDVRSHHFDLLLVGVTPEGEAATEPRILETEAWIPLGFPQWLPGDETVALFGMAPDGPANHLWLIPIRQGDPAVTLAMGEPSEIGSASLSPDGRHVAFSQMIPRGSSIWMVDYGEFLREEGLLRR